MGHLRAADRPLRAADRFQKAVFLQVTNLSDLGLYIGDQNMNPNHPKLRFSASFLPPLFFSCVENKRTINSIRKC